MERAAHTLVNDGAFDENDDEDEDGYKSDDEKDPKATNNDNEEEDDDTESTNSNMVTAGGCVSSSKSSINNSNNSNKSSKYTPHSLPHPLHKTKQPPLHNKQPKNLKQNETKTNALLNQSIFKHRRVLSASNLLALDSSDNDNNNFITDSNNNKLLLRSSSSSLRSLSAFKNRQSYIDNRMSRHKKFKKHRRSMSTSMIGMIGDVITEEDVVIGKDLNFVNHKNHRRSVSTSIISAVTDDGDAEKEDFDLDFDDLVEQQQQQQQKLGIIDGGSVLTEVNRLEEVRRLEEVKCKAQSPSSSQQQDSKPTTTTLQQDYKPSTIEFDFAAVGGVDTLWMAHHAGLAVTKKASRGSILRATSFSKSRLGLAGSSFLNIPSNGNSISNSNRSGGGGPMMRASSIGSTNSNIGTAGTSSHNQSILPTTTTMGSLLNMMESRSPLPTLPSRDYIFRNDSKTASSRNISSADYSNYNDAFVLGDSITTDDNDKSAAVLSSSSLSSTAKFMKEMTEEFNFNGSWISDDKSLTSTYIPEIRMANHIRSISDACKCFLLINFFSFFQYIFLLLIDTIFSYNYSKINFHK